VLRLASGKPGFHDALERVGEPLPFWHVCHEPPRHRRRERSARGEPDAVVTVSGDGLQTRPRAIPILDDSCGKTAERLKKHCPSEQAIMPEYPLN
jgi:hypothetical protein